MLRFKEYLEENNLYVALHKDEPQDTDVLGIVDGSDKEVINKLRSSLNTRAIKTALENLLARNDYPAKNLKELTPVFEKHFYEPDALAVLADIADGKVLYKVKNGSDDVSSIASFYAKYKIPPKFFTDLAIVTGTDQKNASIGKGEFVLGLFTNLSNATKGGDLKGARGEAIEVKGPNGRLVGQSGRLRKSPEIGKDLARILVDNGYPALAKIPFKQKSISNTIITGNKDVRAAMVELSKRDTKHAEDFIRAFFQYESTYKPNAADVNAFRQVVTNGSANEVNAFLASIHMFMYMQNEHIDSFIFFLVDTNYTKFIIANMKGVNSIADVYKVMRQYKLQISGIADTIREAAFGIKMKG